MLRPRVLQGLQPLVEAGSLQGLGGSKIVGVIEDSAYRAHAERMRDGARKYCRADEFLEGRKLARGVGLKLGAIFAFEFLDLVIWPAQVNGLGREEELKDLGWLRLCSTASGTVFAIW